MLIVVMSVFILILLLNHFKVTLSLSLFIGTIILGILLKLSVWKITISIFHSSLKYETVRLLMIVLIILIMSAMMKSSGHMNRIVETFLGISTNQSLISTILPALIGILPMPGGALFSAPMVDEGLKNSSASPELKSAVNYWFRHLWEYWWPLYPGVILAVSLLNLDTWRFSATLFPMTFASIFGGYFFLVRSLNKVKTKPKYKNTFSVSAIENFFREISPIIIIIFFFALISFFKHLMINFSIKLIFVDPVLISMMIGLFVVIWMNKISFTQFINIIKSAKLLPMCSLIIAIMVFKGMLIDTNAVIGIRLELNNLHVPFWLMIIIMPFFSGLITGIAVGYVGLSFPVIIPLFVDQPPFVFLAYALIAYVAGYMGMMLSPVHLCFLVTKDYFHAQLGAIYPYLIKPVIFVFAWTAIMFFIIKNL